MATDEAHWTTQSAANAGKTLGLCCKHKANGILESNKGLGSITQSYLDDLNALIYGIFPSEAVLDEKIISARKKYGQVFSAHKFIDSIDGTRHLLCATIMQNYLTFGHCTTSIGEGWNSLIKGQGELKKYLLSAMSLDLP